jgi:lipopolysaccharide transport system ATP-binding protein
VEDLFLWADRAPQSLQWLVESTIVPVGGNRSEPSASNPMSDVMSDEVAISLTGVSKCFKLYERPADRLKDLLLPTKARSRDFWALRELTTTIHPGQTVGLVGQNGSGKSTLLQLIVGTLTPTTGQVHTRGRIAALLELGSGFNPEFTGRQNVFFNGRVLGLSQAEITDRFDAIAAFADIGDMLEQPVKTYSSGMFIRLAFAVIINTDPDILIVDEALAVGDIYFQQKCFQRIRDLRDRGVTILFVSHDSASVFRLCDRAILLEHGNVVMDGAPKPVLDLYEAKMLKQFENQPPTMPTPAPETATPTAATPVTSPVTSPVATPPAHLSGNIESHEFAQVQFVHILNESGQPIPTVTSGSTVQITIGIWFHQAFQAPHVGFKLRNRQGEVMFETNTHCMGESVGAVAASELVEVRFTCQMPLIDGQYTISVGVADEAIGLTTFRRTLVYAHDQAVITVFKNPKDIIWAGVVNLNPQFSCHRPTPASR